MQVDADIRHSKELASVLDAVEDDGDELQPLCDQVKSWMRIESPESVVVVLPRESTEAWLLAAHSHKKHVETIERPAKALLDAKLIDATAKGRPDKERARYAELARGLDGLVDNKRALAKALPELSRFVGKLRARERAVRSRGRT